MIGLFILGFRLILGLQFLAKSGKTLSIRRLKGVLMTEIPIKAQPLLIVGTVPNGNARALQQRVVQTGKLRGEAQPVMISRNCISCGKE
jgi:hypothetical protein